MNIHKNSPLGPERIQYALGRPVRHFVRAESGTGEWEVVCKIKSVSAHIYGDDGTSRQGGGGLQRNK